MSVSQYDLVLERTLNAPRDMVWKAWTDPKLLKQWFAPKPYEISEVEMDLRPGGIFRIRMTGPDGFDTGHGNPGCLLEVVDGVGDQPALAEHAQVLAQRGRRRAECGGELAGAVRPLGQQLDRAPAERVGQRRQRVVQPRDGLAHCWTGP